MRILSPSSEVAHLGPVSWYRVSSLAEDAGFVCQQLGVDPIPAQVEAIIKERLREE
jgi:hypothetical protein